jgi:hypothetical protein
MLRAWPISRCASTQVRQCCGAIFFRSESLGEALSSCGCRRVVVDPAEMNGDLVQDMAAILRSFCVPPYGRRAAKNRAAKAIAFPTMCAEHRVQTLFDEPWYRGTLALARRLHASQVDKGGRSKADHVERVARRLVTMFLDATKAQVQAALLYHVLEDTDASLLHLLNAEIQPAVLRIVERLTRDEWASYLDYIQSIAASDDISAIRVKLADNLDNSDPARLYPGGDRIACEKYMPARAILEAALAEAERDSRC